jgi:ferredoxin
VTSWWKSRASSPLTPAVKEGGRHLSQMEDLEADRLYSAAGLTLHSRLACQAVVLGDVVVEVAGE